MTFREPFFKDAIRLSMFCVQVVIAVIKIPSSAAQVVPDQSLSETPTTSRIENNNISVIEGGTQVDSNLFHSFDSFSVSNGESVVFNSSDTVSRIFGRVTGGEPSFINGTLQTKFGVDLFLLNPSGILLGSDFSSEIGGALMLSTADRLFFEDNLEFAVGSQPALLSSNIPVGLGFASPNSITVEGEGHQLASGSLILPLLDSAPESGILFPPQSTVALLGGNIDFQGGVIRTLDGTISLGAVQRGYVSIKSSLLDEFDYSNVESFGSIVLDQSSLLDAGGLNGGVISITGGDIRLLNSSLARIETFLDGSNAQINISGQSLLIDGDVLVPLIDFDIGTVPLSPIPFVPSAIAVDNFSNGRAGNIEISSQTISIENGGAIYVRSFGEGTPGTIDISSERLIVDGVNPNISFTGGIGVGNLGVTLPEKRFGGELFIDSDLIEVKNGGAITASTLNQGNGGQIDINSESITVSSVASEFPSPSQITAFALQRSLNPDIGNGGDINIVTGSLDVLGGSVVSTSTDSSGDAGSITVEARESVRVVGSNFFRSAINSSVTEVEEVAAEIFGFAGTPTGDSGSIVITAPDLNIREQGSVNVVNEGSGDAGNILINSQLLRIMDEGDLSASTIQGEGGNINVVTDAIILAENSRISANSIFGSGGRVAIQSTSLIQSSDSLITATSDADPELNGVVEIQGRKATPQSDVQIDLDVGPPSLAVSCVNPGEGEGFVVSGRGGTSVSQASTARRWNGWNAPVGIPSVTSHPNQDNQIVEAEGWTYDANGNVRLVSMDLAANLSARNPSVGCTNTLSQSSSQ